ncbi:hypothetical protein B0H13DRAFT_2350078 [Mycena leptocephala]|nr:hypothetical protein B0H13DRAFT_2350078 [Mycena leptocephala]
MEIMGWLSAAPATKNTDSTESALKSPFLATRRFGGIADLLTHSHRSHSGQFCKHAVGSLEDMILEAIRREFEVYGLTEHVPRYGTEDLHPEEVSLTPDDLMEQFNTFLSEAHRLKALYGDGLYYLAGSRQAGRTFAEKLSTRALSGRLGPPQTRKEAAFLCAHLEAQHEILVRFHPEVVGHFDLCRLYTPTLQIVEYPDACEHAKRNIRYTVDHGALFEVTAAISSHDSHVPHAVGLNYGRLPAYLRRAGVTELWRLQQSEMPNATGRNVSAVKMDQRWGIIRFGLISHPN